MLFDYLILFLYSDVVLVGPVSPRPGKPLPQDLEDFVQSSGGKGIIYVSFGGESNEMSMAPYGVQALARALSKLPFKVLWKTRGKLMNTFF